MQTGVGENEYTFKIDTMGDTEQNTQVLTQCNGKINQQGYCDKCYGLAQTSTGQCIRLIPVEQNSAKEESGRTDMMMIQNLPTEVESQEALWESVIDIYQNTVGRELIKHLLSKQFHLTRRTK